MQESMRLGQLLSDEGPYLCLGRTTAIHPDAHLNIEKGAVSGSGFAHQMAALSLNISGGGAVANEGMAESFWVTDTAGRDDDAMARREVRFLTAGVGNENVRFSWHGLTETGNTVTSLSPAEIRECFRVEAEGAIRVGVSGTGGGMLTSNIPIKSTYEAAGKVSGSFMRGDLPDGSTYGNMLLITNRNTAAGDPRRSGIGFTGTTNLAVDYELARLHVERTGAGDSKESTAFLYVNNESGGVLASAGATYAFPASGNAAFNNLPKAMCVVARNNPSPAFWGNTFGVASVTYSSPGTYLVNLNFTLSASRASAVILATSNDNPADVTVMEAWVVSATQIGVRSRSNAGDLAVDTGNFSLVVYDLAV
jgi:hypothetical protein